MHSIGLSSMDFQSVGRKNIIACVNHSFHGSQEGEREERERERERTSKGNLTNLLLPESPEVSTTSKVSHYYCSRNNKTLT